MTLFLFLNSNDIYWAEQSRLENINLANFPNKHQIDAMIIKIATEVVMSITAIF